MLYAANRLEAVPLLDFVIPKVDVFHASNQVRSPPRKTRLTATIYDMTCRLMPELHTADNIRADESLVKNVISRADGLIAISENSRQDAVRLLGLNPDRIQVIYPGVAGVYFDARATPAERPYVLYIGAIEPRKNVDTLLDAWADSNLRRDFDLVIAGASGWSSEKTMARLASRPSGVRYLGYVPEDELPGLTAGAMAFVYPSLYEGFGLPVAQAMAAGVPVITSNASSLPEIAGEERCWWTRAVPMRFDLHWRNCYVACRYSNSSTQRVVHVRRISLENLGPTEFGVFPRPGLIDSTYQFRAR